LGRRLNLVSRISMRIADRQKKAMILYLELGKKKA
jgi:hypothetical protein